MVQRERSVRIRRRWMAVTDFDDGQPTFGEGRLGQAIGKTAEQEFVRADMESDGRTGVVPTARAGCEIDAAAIRDKARFNGGVWRAQRNRVITKGRVDIAERRQKLFEEFVAGAVGLGHRGQAPKVLFGGEDFGERLSGTRL